MRRVKCLLLAAAFLLAAGVFARHASEAGQRADNVCRNVTVAVSEPLCERDARTLFEQEEATTDEQECGAAFAVWGELADQRIVDPDLGRYAQADVLAVLGSAQLVFSEANGLFAGDAKGCLIGEKTAWELFGSTGVVGDEIRVGNGTRTIRGVMREPGRSVIVAGGLWDITGQSNERELPRYDRITVEGADAREGEAFLTRHALAGGVLRLDCLRDIAWLPELIPGKWSDFSGWKENYKRKAEELNLLLRPVDDRPELFYEKQCLACAWNTALQAACVLAAARWLFLAAKFFDSLKGESYYK